MTRSFLQIGLTCGPVLPPPSACPFRPVPGSSSQRAPPPPHFLTGRCNPSQLLQAPLPAGCSPGGPPARPPRAEPGIRSAPSRAGRRAREPSSPPPPCPELRVLPGARRLPGEEPRAPSRSSLLGCVSRSREHGEPWCPGGQAAEAGTPGGGSGSRCERSVSPAGARSRRSVAGDLAQALGAAGAPSFLQPSGRQTQQPTEPNSNRTTTGISLESRLRT